MRRSVIWQVTCFPLVEWRNNMLGAALRTENDQCLEVVDDQSAARKLQDVLSLRLPSFIAVPSDFWGMRLTQRMRCRKPCWPLTNI